MIVLCGLDSELCCNVQTRWKLDSRSEMRDNILMCHGAAFGRFELGNQQVDEWVGGIGVSDDEQQVVSAETWDRNDQEKRGQAAWVSGRKRKS